MATLLTLLLFLSPDVVILKNGDRITGEVKGAAGGKLTIKTDHSGEIKVSMAAVANLTTTHPVTIELESGEIPGENFASSPVMIPPQEVE